MGSKIYYAEGDAPASQAGDALDALARTIDERAGADAGSYTFRLLTGDVDVLLKKIVEEAHEVTLAAKDACYTDGESADVDHLRYEAADVVYHLMVLLRRFDIPLDEFAAELNSRMDEEGLAGREGIALLNPEHINRGK